MNKIYFVVEHDSKVINKEDVTPMGSPFSLVGFMFAYVLPIAIVQLAMIGMKLCDFIDLRWGVIFLPTFIGVLLFLCVTSFLGVLLIMGINLLIEIRDDETISKEIE